MASEGSGSKNGTKIETDSKQQDSLMGSLVGDAMQESFSVMVI